MDEFTLARIERMTPEQRADYARRCFEDAIADLRRAAENLRNIQAQFLNLARKES
jgi:hypothetical protein